MTSIEDFYAGRTIFITGVTGFMGKVLLEKLLRSCPAVKKLYVLVRPKKGQEPNVRMDDILNSKVNVLLFTGYLDDVLSLFNTSGTLPSADSWYRKPFPRLCPGLY